MFFVFFTKYSPLGLKAEISLAVIKSNLLSHQLNAQNMEKNVNTGQIMQLSDKLVHTGSRGEAGVGVHVVVTPCVESEMVMVEN